MYAADKIKPAWKLTFEGARTTVAWPSALTFAGSHRRVVCANHDGTILMWELPESPVAGKVLDASGKEVDGIAAPPPVKQLVGHENAVTHLVCAPDGKTLISTSLDHTVRFWDLEAAASGEAEVVIDRETRERMARRAPEKEREGMLSAPGVKLATLAPTATLSEHRDWIQALGMSRDGRRVITGDDAGHAIVWDVAKKAKISQWQCEGVAWILAAALSSDGEQALVSQYRRKGGDFNNYPAGLRIYNVADGAVKLDILATNYPKEKNPPYQYQYQYYKFVAEGLVAAAWSPDGKLLAIGQGGEGGEGKVHILAAETGKVLRQVSEHRYGVTDLCFTQDGKFLFTAGRDTTFRIIQVEDGKEVAKIGQPRGGQFTDWLSAISLSPDERWLAAADISGHVQVWQLGQ